MSEYPEEQIEQSPENQSELTNGYSPLVNTYLKGDLNEFERILK